jgi:hypothetical protein
LAMPDPAEVPAAVPVAALKTPAKPRKRKAPANAPV